MNIQLVMAHPDDEVIFGWPMLKQVSSILICSNDKNNPERAWCRYRYKALQEIGELLGIPVKSLDYDSEFYKLSARDGSLRRFIDDVLAHIDPHAQAIYTHNWMGEYGHMDHLLINKIMTLMPWKDKHIITSDIHLYLDEWVSFEEYATRHNPDAWKIDLGKSNDLELYNQCKAIYEKYDSWTWSQEPVSTCNLYHL